MNYRSTRDSSISVTSAEAIIKGIAPDGGLFVPENMPWLSYNDIGGLVGSDYATRAADILGRFLTDFTSAEIQECVGGAYTREKFETSSITPIYMLNNTAYLLELWHGPTCAFKDMALQLLPHLMKTAVRKTGADKTIVILVATSGDTGKAALAGFHDVPGTEIIVFYPENGVSSMQKLQMVTQQGANVHVCAIKGNFDDAQSGVKALFTDNEVNAQLLASNKMFSSANSINWGRLVPQIVYYVSAYCDLIKNGKLTCGEPVNVVVPTGNFGNILAAYYAKKMGIPINRLICASNENNVLTEFIKTGIYNRNRQFYTTISPSMDILVSSNLERLLYDLSACEDVKVRGWMQSLAKYGIYEVDDGIKSSLREHFWAGFCDDAGTKRTISEINKKYSYVCDPHTAVALNVYAQYKEKTADTTKTIIASTASPFKFAGNVLSAITGRQQQTDERALLHELAKLSLCQVPKQIDTLFDLPIRFNDSCEIGAMREKVFNVLGIK